MLIRSALGILIALSLAGACNNKSGESGAKDEPGLAMSSDSEVCKKAMHCCELNVKITKGSASPEDINLSCSGVALAETDEACEEFRRGFVASIEAAGKELPGDCK